MTDQSYPPQSYLIGVGGLGFLGVGGFGFFRVGRRARGVFWMGLGD